MTCGMINGREPAALSPRETSVMAAPITAGALEATFDQVDIVELRYCGLEVLRCVGVRVRTPAWSTLPPEASGVAVERSEQRARITFQAAHRDGDIAFSWNGMITLADGRVIYELDGYAERAFDYARIGIVVLHPPAVTAGRTFRAWRSGRLTEGALPKLVGPQLIIDGEIKPLFPAFEELEIDATPQLSLRLQMEGDLFEMEDQRNWTDGSFKTYSTPVGQPVPHHARAGQQFRQRVSATVSDSRSQRSRRRHRPSAPGPLSVTVVERAAGPSVPPIGTTLPARQGRLALTRGEPEAIKVLGLAYLRVELDGAASLDERLTQASLVAAGAAARLELALRLPSAERTAAGRLKGVASSVTESMVACVTLAREGEEVTGAATAHLARKYLPALVLLGGSPANFAELNRQPPPLDAPLDGLFYAANPQVHDSGDRSLMQSPLAQRDTVLTARRLWGDRPVHISPITLLPASAGQADPRQRELFTAAWTVASAAGVVSSGAAAVTWFEAAGPGGLVDGDALFPAYHVLRELCAWQGRRVVAATCSEPETVAALAVSHAGELCMLLANLTAVTRKVSVRGISGRPELGFLDVRTSQDANPFASSARMLTVSGGDPLSLALEPHAVVRLRCKPHRLVEFKG